MVLDGATGLSDPAMSIESDGHWLVSQLAFHAQQPAGDAAFEDRLRCAVTAVAALFAAAREGVTDRFATPSAGMVAIECRAGDIRLHRIGDCTMLVRRGAKISEPFAPSPLVRLDTASIAALQRLLDEGLDAKAARERLLPTLRRHRARMNVPGGYGVLSTASECLDWLESRYYQAADGDEILLATDGFIAASDVYHLYDRQALFDHLANHRSGEVIATMRDAERADPGLSRHPRLKQHDDATATLLRLSAPTDPIVETETLASRLTLT